MDINGLKIGNTYKFRVRRRVFNKNKPTNEFEVKELILAYKNKDNERAYFINRTGERIGVFINDIISISSTKISPEERMALSNLAKSQIKKEKLEQEYKILLEEASKAVISCEKDLKSVTPILTQWEFGVALAEYIEEKYRISVQCNSWGGEAIVLTQKKDIQKYATQDEYSFIHTRYDGTSYIEDEDLNYKRTLKNYSLNTLIPLKKVSSQIEEYLSLGDKNWLSVCKAYKIPVKEFTKNELENIKKKIS